MEFVNGDTSGYCLPSTCASVSINDRFVFCVSSNSKDDATWNELGKILNAAGVQVLAVDCRVTEDTMEIQNPVKIKL